MRLFLSIFLTILITGCSQHFAESEITGTPIASIENNSIPTPTIAVTNTMQVVSPTPTKFLAPKIRGKIAFFNVNQELYVVDFECIKLSKECDTRITYLTNDIDDLRAPSWSPDGKYITFAQYRYQKPARIYIVNIENGKKVQITDNLDLAHQPVWSPNSNRIAFVGNNGEKQGIQIVTADYTEPMTTLMTTLENVFLSSLSWAPDGTRLAVDHDVVTRGGWLYLYILDADGKSSSNPKEVNIPAKDPILSAIEWGRKSTWSPDGKRIAYVCGNIDTGQNICTFNLETEEHHNLTTNSATDGQPMWSPDGKHIAFISDRDGNREIYIVNADGSGETRLTNTAADEIEPGWSPDGNYLTFMSNRDAIYSDCNISSSYTESVRYYLDSDCNYEIYIMKVDGTEQYRLTNNDTCDIYPVWAPQ